MRATANAMTSARRLRRKLSPPEMFLWQLLKVLRRQVRFRRQHAIGPYVADFYCPKARLIVEVDGATHDFTREKDGRRDAYFTGMGFRVVRVAAVDVLSDPEGVADSLVRMALAASGPSTTQPGG